MSMDDDDNATTNITKRMLFAHKIHIFTVRISFLCTAITKAYTKTNYMKTRPMDFSTDTRHDAKIIWHKKKPVMQCVMSFDCCVHLSKAAFNTETQLLSVSMG